METVNKLWRVLNDAMGRSKMAKTPSFIELNGEFITKPSDIANYFNNYFLSKVNTLRNQMLPVSGGLSKAIIQNHIMCGKDCVFDFKPISADFRLRYFTQLSVILQVICERKLS